MDKAMLLDLLEHWHLREKVHGCAKALEFMHYMCGKVRLPAAVDHTPNSTPGSPRKKSTTITFNLDTLVPFEEQQREQFDNTIMLSVTDNARPGNNAACDPDPSSGDVQLRGDGTDPVPRISQGCNTTVAAPVIAHEVSDNYPSNHSFMPAKDGTLIGGCPGRGPATEAQIAQPQVAASNSDHRASMPGNGAMDHQHPGNEQHPPGGNANSLQTPGIELTWGLDNETMVEWQRPSRPTPKASGHTGTNWSSRKHQRSCGDKTATSGEHG
ncbi:hypothetical protein DXG01_010010 [Tephrocybe rancida]|nr:hypothetical protein DXG01_010010 [Tephrocybe rancida]